MGLAALLVIVLNIAALSVIKPDIQRATPQAPSVEETSATNAVPQAFPNGQQVQQTPATRTFALAPMQPVRSDATGEQSLATGQATLTDTPQGLRIDLAIQNLPGDVNTKYPANIRRGLCFEGGSDPPMQAELQPVAIPAYGAARSTSVLSDQTLGSLLRGNSSISVEVEQAAWFSSSRISCADLGS